MNKYPNTFYRVSLKAIIRNAAGEVLVVKEKQNSWSLPGGGLDHGEDARTGLARELQEEVLFSGIFTEKLTDVATFYVTEAGAWLMWLVFEVDVPEQAFGVGPDADEIAFMHPNNFKHSPYRSEQLVYRFAHKKETT